MKHKNKLLALFLAVTVLFGTMGAEKLLHTVSAADVNYEKNVMYDATETHIKLQPSSYSYNGYKVVPFITCDTYLSSNGVGTGYAFGSAKELSEGDKVVIEFKTPIDSSEFEIITISMKQVPGNYYNAYNVSDDILSTVRKSFNFGSYGVEKISFQTSLFADDNGMVSAILLQNTKSEMQGQLFVDEFYVSNSPYKLNEEYDATSDYLKGQNATSYQGLQVVPFGEFSTFWDKEAKIEEGSALIASKPEGAALVNGEVLILEFVNDISAKKFKYINLQLTTTTQGGATFEFYNVNEITNNKLSSVKHTGKVDFWSFTTISLPTSQFADEGGNVSSIAMKLTSKEAATFSVGSFSLSATAKTGNQTSGGQNGGAGSAVQGADSKNQYDATGESLVVQVADNYNGLQIVPFIGCGTELSALGVGEGYAIYTHENIKKDDVIVIEFVNLVDSKKVDLITVSMKQTAGYSYSVYKGTDTKLSSPVKNVDFGSYDIEKTSFRTALFADDNGMVKSLILKCEKAGEAGQIFIDGYSLGNDPYQLGVTYDVDENYVKLQNASSYKGLTVAPFGERTTFWSNEAKVDSDEGCSVVAHRADNSDLQKGDVMILEFVTDIAANKYEVLNLTLATAAETGATFEVYNVYEIENGKLGPMKQRVKADFWSFKTNNIALESLADANGYVGAIALKLISDKAPTFSVGSFSLGTLESLVEKNAPQILDNKITVLETNDAYEFTIEFNRTGAFNGTYNEKTVGELVSLNGVKLSDINKENSNVKLSMALMGRYCMTLSVDKEYDGAGSVINADKHFVGNCVEIEKGFVLPNGEELTDTFAMHVYLVDSITDVIDNTQKSAAIGINSLSSYVDENDNLIINVHFNNEITGNPLYYLCNPDSFNRKEVAKLNGEAVLYDANVAKAFIYGGYKSSLLDNMKINGNTLAEWLAMDELAGSHGYNSAIMVHYGQMGNKVATIMIAAASEISRELNQSYEEGTLEVTLNEGLKFPSGRGMGNNVTYRYSDSVWNQVSSAEFAVYYDGQKVEDGDSLTVNNIVSANNITVLGEGEYHIEEKITGKKAQYTILEGDEELLQFTVEGEEVMPVNTTGQIPMVVVIAAAFVILFVGVVVYFMRKGKKHAEKMGKE